MLFRWACGMPTRGVFSPWNIFLLLIISVISTAVARIHNEKGKTIYGTLGYSIDVRPHYSYQKMSSVRISTPNMSRYSDVIFEVAYEGKERSKISVPMKPYGRATTVELATPEREFNVSVSASYRIGKHKLEIKPIRIGPIVKTCNKTCYNQLKSNAEERLSLRVGQREYGLVSVDVKFIPYNSRCYNEKLNFADVTYATTSGRIGYVKFLETPLPSFTLSDIEEFTQLRVRCRFDCNRDGQFVQYGTIDTGELTPFETITDAMDVVFDKGRQIAMAYITMPSVNKYPNVKFVINTKPMDGNATLPPVVVKRTPGLTSAKLPIREPGHNYEITVEPKFLIGSEEFTGSDIKTDFVTIGVCDANCYEGLNANGENLTMHFAGEGRIRVAITLCPDDEKTIRVSYGSLDGNRGYVVLNDFKKQEFILPNIEKKKTIRVRVAFMCQMTRHELRGQIEYTDPNLPTTTNPNEITVNRRYQRRRFRYGSHRGRQLSGRAFEDGGLAEEQGLAEAPNNPRLHLKQVEHDS